MIACWFKSADKCQPLNTPKITPQIPRWPSRHEAFNDVFVASYHRHHPGCTSRI
ncbi:hypothetical protein BDR05DRAFT_962907 [Suillus weaverae]|nr:hypothetical protein BDR05DRAFT_962907 [Suillus weaverae]